MRVSQNFVSTLLCFVILLATFSLKAFADTSKGFSVIQVREISYLDSPAIRVRFSEPLNTKGVEGKIQLVKKSEEDTLFAEPEYSWLVDKDTRSIIFPFVEPDTEYQVTVDASLRSQAGNKLGKSDATDIITKHLPARANFSSTGSVMPLTGPKTLPVTVTNINEVSINFYYISPEQYDAFLKTKLNAGTEYNYQLQDFVQKADFIYTSRFLVSPKKNQRTSVNLDISHITKLQQPGLYVAVMSKAGQYESRHSVIHFTVSDLALHVRQYKHKSVVQVMDFVAAKPAEDVSIRLFDKDGDLLSKAMTDSNGISEVVTPDNSTASYLIAEKRNNITILPLKTATLDLSDFNNALSPHADIQAFSFGPRDLFRPGETAQIQVLLRDYDGQQLSNIPLSVTLTRPDGQVAQSTVLQPQATGYYLFNYQLSQSSPTGQWKVSYQAAGQKLNQHYSFNVEDFRPDRLQLVQLTEQQALSINDNNQQLVKNSQKLSNRVKGIYLFGAKASGNKVDGVINASFNRHPLPEYKPYFFGDDRENIYSSNWRLRPFNLNNDGQGEIAINNPWKHFKSPIKLTYTLNLYDSGGHSVTSKESTTLISGNGLVGIKPNFSGNPDKNAKVSFSILSLAPDLAISAGDALQVSLIKEDRNYYWSYDEYRGWQFEYDASPYEVWDNQISTDEHGLASLEVPLEYGHYQLVVTNKNTAVTSTYSFKTAGRWWNNSRESSNRPDTILMSFDKETYVTGDLAELSYYSPHNGQAWFTVENNNGIVYQQSFEVAQGEGKLALTIPKTWDRHDNYATLMIVKHNDKLQAAKNRAFGLVHLPLQRANMRLHVALTAPASSLPLHQVNATVQVSDTENLTGDTYAVAALVDVGILNITQYPRPRPEDYFLAPRRYEVEIADLYNKLIQKNSGKTLAQAFGGDMLESDDELSRGGKKPDADVALVSMLSAPIKLDEQGKAKVSFELPEFAGKLRWAVVVFNQNQFGSAEQFTNVSSPFVSQLSSPYFLAPGDLSKAALEVHNTTAQAQQLSVNITTSGSLDATSMIQKIALEAGQKHSFSIPLKSNGTVSDGHISYQIESLSTEPQYKVAKHHKIPVRLAYPSLTEATHFVLAEGEAWQPQLNLDNAINGSIQGQLTLSTTPPLALNSYFDYLLAYPYGCLEQTTSRALPWLFIDGDLVDKYSLNDQIQLRMDTPFSESLPLEVLQKAIEELTQKQRADGSFSLWSGAAHEYAWLTVYATELLVEAVKSNVLVPKAMVDKAIKVLSKYVKRPDTIIASHWSENIDYYKASVRAYAGYVLAKANKVSLSDLRRAGSDMSKQKVQGRLPWMHLAVSFKLIGAEKNTQKALELAAKFARPSGYIGDYGSKVRDLAWAYSLSLTHQLNTKLNYIALQQAINNKQWLSTQEKARLFVLASQLKDDSKAFSALIEFNDKAAQSIEHKSRFNVLLDQQQVTKLATITSANEKIYGSLIHAYASTTPPQPKSDIIEVEKTYYDFEGFATELDDIQSGQLLIVALTLKATKNIRDALVVDLLPAGLILENQNLGDASVDISVLEVEGKAIVQPAELSHQEFREDRYVAAIELSKDTPVRLFYLARATATGQYKVPATYVEDMFNPEDYGLGDAAELKVNE